MKLVVKPLLVCGVLAFAVRALAGGVSCVDLAGDWNLTGRDGEGRPVACPVRVPGDVHSALLDAKLMPDPFWGRNELKCQWVATEDWTFARTFEVDSAFLAKRRIVLELEDVDTFADVYLNGVKVGTASDRFARWTFDAKAALKAGRNELKAVFRSAAKEGNRRREAIGREYTMANMEFYKNQALIRKPACHAGWDWGLCQMVTGFCGPVRLVGHDGLKVDYVYTDQAFNADFTHCDLTVYADVTDADGRASTVTNVVAIDNPPLWWPNGAGEHRFYTYSVKVGDETVTRRVGLRKIEILNTPDVDANGKSGARMAVRVNGRELFMKGANWIPCDAFESRQTPARYRDLVGSAARANMNMLRVWGGGQFEHDAFYDACDELGVLVWHDQMFSCAVYPADEQFLSEVRNELSHQIRRLRDHASIALWCGDNECVGAVGGFPVARADPEHYKGALVRRHAVQDEMVAKYDPARMFWPSSPCGGPGNYGNGWKNDSSGDMHNWDVWHENKPFSRFYAYTPRFCSEFGFQSFPSMEVAETFAERSDIEAHGPDFEWHQKGGVGNRRIRETMAMYFKAPKDVESELLLSQFQQAMAIKTAVEAWRAQRPRCMGTLFWQLNDNWPVASWSSIEYGGKWKPLQYAARRFYAPVSLVAQPEITNRTANVRRGRVFALNDTAETLKGELTVEYWTYGGQVAATKKASVSLPPDGATAVLPFDVDADVPAGEKTFLVMTLTTAHGRAQNDWHFDFYRNAPLANANVTVGQSADGRSLVLTADKPAFFVWANARGVRGEFDDNCLTLLPGRPQTITWLGETVSANVSVTHLKALEEMNGVKGCE